MSLRGRWLNPAAQSAESPLKTMASGRLPKTSGFPVSIVAGIGVMLLGG